MKLLRWQVWIDGGWIILQILVAGHELSTRSAPALAAADGGHACEIPIRGFVYDVKTGRLTEVETGHTAENLTELESIAPTR